MSDRIKRLMNAPNSGESHTVPDTAFRQYRIFFNRKVMPDIAIAELESGRQPRVVIRMENQTFARLALWFLWRWVVFDWCGLRTARHVKRHLGKRE